MTATARAIDSSESTSALQDAALRFVDAVEMALQLTADWIGEINGGSIDIRTDFGPSEVSADRLKALLTARYGDNKRPGDLSREDFLEQLQEMQVISDDFDPARNLMRLMSEAAVVGFDVTKIDSNDFQPEKEPEENLEEEKTDE